MTQEEAVIMALNDLGGKAHQKDIYKRAMKYATFGGKTPDATIRALLQRCDRVRHSKDAPGLWELVSYQEELAKLYKQNKEMIGIVETLRKLLELPAVFERIANECMNATQTQNVSQRVNIVNMLNTLKANLNISVSDETNSRLKKFAAENSSLDSLAIDYLKNINSLMESLNERMESFIQKPTIGTVVLEQNNFGEKGKLTGKVKNNKMIEK